jgi:hypothetical protein
LLKLTSRFSNLYGKTKSQEYARQAYLENDVLQCQMLKLIKLATFEICTQLHNIVPVQVHTTSQTEEQNRELMDRTCTFTVTRAMTRDPQCSEVFVIDVISSTRYR